MRKLEGKHLRNLIRESTEYLAVKMVDAIADADDELEWEKEPNNFILASVDKPDLIKPPVGRYSEEALKDEFTQLFSKSPLGTWFPSHLDSSFKRESEIIRSVPGVKLASVLRVPPFDLVEPVLNRRVLD
jgi:hypothetical protein